MTMRAWLAGLAGLMISTTAATAADTSTAMVENPCPPPLTAPAQGAPAAEMDAYRAAQAASTVDDWPNMCRYRADNAAVTGPVRVVFMGDSITQGWVRGDPQLFGPGVVGRGISSQTSQHMLLRFYSDVIALKPQVVHIMAGTNDIAGNSGPTTEQNFKNNLMAMVELAQGNGIRVVLASIPPAGHFYWKPQHHPAQKIREMNAWLKGYAAQKNATYVDYYAVLADPSGALKKELGGDGVHPNAQGYALMRPLTLQAIGAAR